jgi:hypothetical protein
LNLVSRNSAIIEALKDGYTQGKIARWVYLLLWFLMFLGVVMITGMLADAKVLRMRKSKNRKSL